VPPEPPKPKQANTKRAGTVPSETPQQRKKPISHVPASDPSCVDEQENCGYWAKSGECENNAAFMKASCRASCGICKGGGKPPPRKRGACEDTNDNCATWAAIGECQSNPGFMLANCPVTCKMCQSETCKDDLPDCTERCRGPIGSNFSDSFHCYAEPELTQKCAWTCGACKEHRFDRPECKRRKGVEAAAKPGSVNEIFHRIVRERGDAMQGGKVTVHSAPAGIGAPQGAPQRGEGDPDGPWLITIDDFLSSDESDEVIRAGSQGGKVWQRSQAGDGVQSSRTSSTAWCGGACAQNPTIKAVEKRVSELLGGIPMENAEPMQVLRYETGQFYKTHHDQNSPRASAWGPRMFTVFMYVGDGYEGGLTNFPKLNVTIPAKKGAVCVWTSILDTDPYQRDDRTDHQSLPVESGVKYGVNYWIHMYPFRTMQQGACGNQAYIQNWY